MKINFEIADKDEPKTCTIKVKAFFLYQEKQFCIKLFFALWKGEKNVWELVHKLFDSPHAEINGNYNFIFEKTENLKLSLVNPTDESWLKLKKEYELI